MYGMSVREVLGRADMVPFIDGGLDGVTAPDDPLTVRDCLDLMLAGSFPEPTLSCCAGTCRCWRSTPLASPPSPRCGPPPGSTPRPRRPTSRCSSGCSSSIKRLVKSPKRYLVDPALVAAALGLGRAAILYGPDMLGRLLDTFVAAQLRAELAASSNGPRLYHLRAEQGRREVDLLIETAGGQPIGIEVKAAVTVSASDARHLARLRDQTGDAFTAGIILHTGPHVFPVSDRDSHDPSGRRRRTGSPGALFPVRTRTRKSALASAICMWVAHQLLRDSARPRAASVVFAATVLLNLFGGRITFLVGLAPAMVAILALSRRHPWLAGAATIVGYP